ncbi:hypothetical protein F5884DRAFT_862927 [Xylogone sp. PMI_703]|nr:hypothetical protein F5884DRAFT_862927 [Xylogone sp. PMI_703]
MHFSISQLLLAVTLASSANALGRPRPRPVSITTTSTAASSVSTDVIDIIAFKQGAGLCTGTPLATVPSAAGVCKGVSVDGGSDTFEGLLVPSTLPAGFKSCTLMFCNRIECHGGTICTTVPLVAGQCINSTFDMGSQDGADFEDGAAFIINCD